MGALEPQAGPEAGMATFFLTYGVERQFGVVVWGGAPLVVPGTMTTPGTEQLFLLV